VAAPRFRWRLPESAPAGLLLALGLVGMDWVLGCQGRNDVGLPAVPPRSRLMDEFGVSVEIRDGCQVVAVVGDLDGDTAPLLEHGLESRPVGLPVVVDLGGVGVLTSAGMVALLRE
jgi:hypothetical protein